MVRRFVPLIVLLAIVALAAWRLASPEEQTIRSQLVGQPVPEFDLQPALEGREGLSTATLEGPRAVNLFGSWCIPCIAEAPLLDALASEGVVIDGIAVRDAPGDVSQFLADNGDPYARIAADPESEGMIAFGASGVPETFLIDRSGRIAYHHQGPIAPQDLPILIAEWRKLQ